MKPVEGIKRSLIARKVEVGLSRSIRLAAWLFISLILTSCASGSGHRELESAALGEYAQSIAALQPAAVSEGQGLMVVATISLVADLAGRVGGRAVELTTLLPYGADPHGYSATPQDLRRVAEAHVVLSTGFDLEGSLLADLKQAAPAVPVVSLSEGMGAIEFGPDLSKVDDEQGGDSHQHAGVDPHVWFDPIRVKQWATNAAEAYGRLDPENSAEYKANSSRVRAELDDLDRWIRGQLEAVPAEKRLLVTDHLALAYFAQRYDFELVGALIPAYSSSAEVSARDLADLQALAQQRQVAAIFVGSTANPALAQQISADLGIPLVRLYTGSLTPPGGEAGDYFEFMRYNVNAIVQALAP